MKHNRRRWDTFNIKDMCLSDKGEAGQPPYRVQRNEGALVR